MKNPYDILGVPQNATKVQIVKAQVKALREKKHDAREIASAQKELSNPARRLAVDFTFPILPEARAINKLEATVKSKEMDINDFDPNKYNTLDDE